jgi:protein-disulfide isomerase
LALAALIALSPLSFVIAGEPAEAPLAPLPEMAIGDPKAPVTIVEYSSLSCPHCAALHKDVLPKLKSAYIDKGQLRYVIREFPLNQVALAAAMVTRCVEPSKYFSFVDTLFEKQDKWAFKDDALTPLKGLANEAGLTDEQFGRCLTDATLQKQIMSVRFDAVKAGVDSTPTLFVNGKLLDDGASLENVVAAMKPYLGE